jgi:DNA primase
METGEHEVNFRFGERRVRIRGLERNKSYDQLKVNILVGRGEAFFVDSVDLYHARQRAAFLGQAADELKISAEVLKKDLGQVLLSLEALQEQAMAEKLSPKTTQVVLSAEDKAEALELLRDPRLCDRIVADFARCGVVGEETNKLVGYIAAVSRKLAEPLAVIVQSSSAAGKSSLMDAVLAFVPEEERVQYSAMTGQSLYYLGETELSHKLLAIVEEEGAERASYALKLLQSEGELTIASTGKDPQTGKLVTNEYRVMGPVMIFLTTTAIEIDEELLNRCLVLTVDEGAAQTAAIHERQRHSRTLAGLLGRRDKDSLLRVHQNAQRLLRRLPVVNPYAEKLTFAAHKTRMRRDHMKYLALIETIALLHQYQREVKTVVHGGETIEYIEVTRADIAVANRLAHQVLGRTLDELPPQTRRLLGLLDELVQAACLRQGIERSEFRFSRRQVREYTEWGNTQVRVHLAQLVEMEYVLVHRGSQGQGYVYELCHDGRGPGGEPRLSGLTDAETLDGDASTTTTSRGLNTTSRGSEGHFAGGVRPVGGVVAGRERRAESDRASSNSASSGRNGGPSGAQARQGARPIGPSYTREPGAAAPPVSAAAPTGAVLEA